MESSKEESAYSYMHKMFLIAGLLVVVLLGFWVFSGVQTFSQEASIGAYAARAIEACADAVYRPSCYDVEIPRYMDEGLSLEDSFKVAEIVQTEDSAYWYCHVLGHNVSAKEAAVDPYRWTDVVARCPVGVCSNGCLHGAFQERFRGEVVSDEELEELIPEIRSICDVGDGRNFTRLEQASCYHAVGHLTMYITNAEIERAVEVCDRVSVKNYGDFRPLCYDGAYMQIFQPLEPEDIALVQDIAPTTQEEAIEFCDQFSGPRRDSCHSESHPLFMEDMLQSPDALINFCNRGFSAEGERRCLNAVFYIITPRLNFDIDRIAGICDALPEREKSQCYANSASRFVETDYKLSDAAAELCAVAQEKGVGGQCYRELLFYSGYNFHQNTEQFDVVCNALPGEWGRRCFEGEGIDMRFPRN